MSYFWLSVETARKLSGNREKECVPGEMRACHSSGYGDMRVFGFRRLSYRETVYGGRSESRAKAGDRNLDGTNKLFYIFIWRIENTLLFSHFSSNSICHKNTFLTQTVDL